jgi:hypothetical protein
MALIWADGLTGKALAPLWCTVARAKADAADTTLAAARRGAAFQAAIEAEQEYRRAVEGATKALREIAQRGQPRTHVLIVGVAAYDSADFQPLDTAVYGARAFADWILTSFCNPDRPLGSVEFVNSALPAQGDWIPCAASAAQLGLGAGALTLPTEPATFDNIRKGFEALMARAGTMADNAALVYLSSHGILKSEPMLCPADAQLPGTSHGARNLIAPVRTLFNSQNHLPSVQCYFIDACSEYNPDTSQNKEELPAEPLSRAGNAPFNEEIDASIFFGSCAGRKAYGPENGPPFFTQELMRTLERRAADSVTGFQEVTTSSLKETLVAAGRYRGELEKLPIKFSAGGGWANTMAAKLCRAGNPCEVFVNLQCVPKAAMQGTLYLKNGKGRRDRPEARPEEWYMTLPHGDALAGVEFRDQPFADTSTAFSAVPPVYPVLLKPEPRTR